jgi:hypothetical protein
MKLTGAPILVSRDMKVLQAAPDRFLNVELNRFAVESFLVFTF